jgi:hypothetical protein
MLLKKKYVKQNSEIQVQNKISFPAEENSVTDFSSKYGPFINCQRKEKGKKKNTH